MMDERKTISVYELGMAGVSIMEAEVIRLQILLAASVARERRLQKALEGAAATLEYQAARATQQTYHPTTARRYAEFLRGFAYDIRFALRVAVDAQFAARAGYEGEEEPHE